MQIKVDTPSLETPSRTRAKTVIRPPRDARFHLMRHLAALPHFADLLRTLSLHRIKVRYHPSALGLLWAVLQPLSMMGTFVVLFAIIGATPSSTVPPALFFYTGLVPFTFFATTVGGSSAGLIGHAHLISKVYFPREILPLTYMVAALFDFAMAFLVLLGLMWWYGIGLTMHALYAIPIVLVLMVFAVAVALFLSIVQVRLRDVGIAIPLLMQLWMFVTPIMYSLDAIPADVRLFYALNPTVGTVENFRRVLVQGQPPDFASLGIAALVSTLVLIPAYAYFKQVEGTLADTI